MAKIMDSLGRPIMHSLDGLPIHVRQLADMFRGHGQRQGRNKNGVNDVDRFDDGVITTREGNTKATHFDPETGRPITERGTITEDFGSSTRGDNATDIGNLGESTDDGGHLGGHRFYGDTPDEGIAPQAANLNRGAWKKMENEWADWVSRGFRVDYSIDVTPPGAIRPDSFEVEYTVTNPTTNEVVHRNWPEFENVSGQTFNRVSRGDMPTTESPGGAP